MKDLSFEAIGVLIVLLPGFLAARMVQSLTTRKKQSDFEKVLEALVYSFLVYVLYSALGLHLPIDWSTRKDAAGIDHYLVELHSNDLLRLTCISMALPLLLAVIENRDLSGKLFRVLRITKRTARAYVWLDTFQDYKGWVQVELKDGRHVVGWVLRYSGEPEESTLYLSCAHWFDTTSGDQIDIPGEGILLTKAVGIQYVMFLDSPVAKQPISPASSPAKQAAAAGNALG